MAFYDALLTVMELLDDIIHHGHHPAFLSDHRSIIESLHKNFSLLKESLNDYSSNGDEAAHHVEGLIQDASYRAHDLIELEIPDQIKPRNVVKRAIHKFTSSSDTKLKKLKQEIDSILRKLATIKERQDEVKNLQLSNDSPARGASSDRAPIGKTTVVGFDKYLMTIKDQLCGYSSHLRVIPIVGTGGIGKTTLARHIFDDALIKHHFDYHGWVTVSQDYSVKNVVYKILISMGVEADELREQESALKEKLYKFFKGRRYIVILDDVWSTGAWDDLKCIFPDDDRGSRVMLTTRLLDVAQYTSDSEFVHEMQFLDAEESWTLFQEQAFGRYCCPTELEEVGRSIANKCHGLPLAIVMIAGVLSNAKQPQNWKVIATNMSAILGRNDDRVSRIFTLSYNHLSHRQKVCFLYMGSFPEDYQIRVSDLIKLWIAEGFLKAGDEAKSLEKVGEECLEELVRRNLVVVTVKRANGKFKFCVLHDLLRDFCKQEAFRQRFFVNHGDGVVYYPERVKNSRRFNVHAGNLFEGYPVYPREFVRSILWFSEYYRQNFDEIKWDKVKLLRVLGVFNGTPTSSIPNGILELFRLRYLQLMVDRADSFDMRFPVPQSLLMLQNLQTLIIRHNENHTISLPAEVWMSTRLRHVIIDRMTLPPVSAFGDARVQKLEHLQTLMRLHDFSFTDKAIEMIPNLRKLETHCEGYTSVDCWDFYRLNNLINFLQLEELKIAFYRSPRYVGLPKEFRFPVNLTKLSLINCGFPWECINVVGSLPNLQVLKIKYSFLGDEWKLTEGEFEGLKVLKLEFLDLMYWQVESCHFPRLEYLRIRRCTDLEEIPSEIGDIPTLKLIEVYQSNNLRESVTKIQEEQEYLENVMLQVRIFDG